MNNDMKKYLLMFSPLIIIAVILSFYATGNKGAIESIPASSTSPKPAVEDNSQKLCLESNGLWKQMPTPCQGTCDYERKVKAGQGPLCAQMIIQGCDCGTDKCWNGQSCEAL
jgi:hypothetical protein